MVKHIPLIITPNDVKGPDSKAYIAQVHTMLEARYPDALLSLDIGRPNDGATLLGAVDVDTMQERDEVARYIKHLLYE
jgi:hypothetical protein